MSALALGLLASLVFASAVAAATETAPAEQQLISPGLIVVLVVGVITFALALRFSRRSPDREAD